MMFGSSTFASMVIEQEDQNIKFSSKMPIEQYDSLVLIRHYWRKDLTILGAGDEDNEVKNSREMSVILLIATQLLFELTNTATIFRRVCSYCRDREIFENAHLYAGFFQKLNTGPLQFYSCVADQGYVMKCATSCIQAQLIVAHTNKVYTYRDCGTLLLQEFGREKYNFSHTQYAMALVDYDDLEENKEETEQGNRAMFSRSELVVCSLNSDNQTNTNFGVHKNRVQAVNYDLFDFESVFIL
ncbi:hypothetical protein KIN20_008248 [Parelaphostrongylus tenuis]|uniref:Uncharacterized protein n=1 Tax=Parelaphostrongylus tenuis TaxID=148309 RepID=A0AAD5QJP9_PARTN|nr:hypothetical protein KIN20_008248 [Parelaphostrongylus tenuis]